jgi:hypothetical protein
MRLPYNALLFADNFLWLPGGVRGGFLLAIRDGWRSPANTPFFLLCARAPVRTALLDGDQKHDFRRNLITFSVSKAGKI